MIQLDVKDVEVNGVAYRLQKVPAGQAWPMALWIKEVRAQAAAAMGKVVDLESSATRIGVAAALGGAEGYEAKMLRDPQFMAGVVKPLLAHCARMEDGLLVPVSLDGQNAMYYGNRLDELLKVYNAAVEFNFAPFFDAFSSQTDGDASARTDPGVKAGQQA